MNWEGGLFHHFIPFSCSIFLFFVMPHFIVLIIQWEWVCWEWFLLSTFGGSLMWVTLDLAGYGQCYQIGWVIQPAMTYDVIYGG